MDNYVYNMEEVLGELGVTYHMVHSLVQSDVLSYELRGPATYDYMWLNEESYRAVKDYVADLLSHPRVSHECREMGYVGCATPEKTSIVAPFVETIFLEAQIDYALRTGNKEEFMRLTSLIG